MEVTSHPAGTFCFPELSTRDMDGAKRFYGGLLGWSWLDVPSAAGGYSLLQVAGTEVAGLHRSERGEPSWLCYVAVDGADRVAARVVELGGTVLAAPFDVPGVGRMALVQDPARARFGLWEARGMVGARLEDEPGAPCWYELVTHDLPAATRFYADLLGWTAVETAVQRVGPYTTAGLGGRPVAGLMSIRREWGEVSPRWQVYFAVPDCARAAGQAAALQGSVIAGPLEVPEIGRFALLADPCDAVFAVLEAPFRP